MTDEIAIEKALLLGQVRPPDTIARNDERSFFVIWRRADGRNLGVSWRRNRWECWQLYHIAMRGEDALTISGFPAVLEAFSDPAFRKRYGIEPMEK